MRKFFTILLLVIIGFIAIFQITLMKNKNLFEEVCAYQSSMNIDQSKLARDIEVDKKFLAICFGRETIKMITAPRSYCQSIARPKCEIRENDIFLCDGQIKQGKWTGTKEDCQLSWACPELVDDYQNLLKICQK